MSFNVFVRQPFTQSSEGDRTLLQSAMDVLRNLESELSLNFLTSLDAQSSDSFKKFFEASSGQPFTPSNFRRYRLGLIDKADAFVVLRTGLSESGSFEVAYNVFSGRNAPVFFAVWEKSPIKTTLLRELEDICPARYVTFAEAGELIDPLRQFFLEYHGKK